MAIARATPTGLVQRGGLSRAAPTGIFQAPAATPAITLQPAPALLTITGYAPLLATTILPDAASLTITGYAPLLATTILPDAASLTVTGLAPAVAAALYPAPGDVRYGVIYGPDGIYTGTLRNSGGVWLRRR